MLLQRRDRRRLRLTQDEINYRLYYRVKKVLQRHRARFGLENWVGSPIGLLTPFYDWRNNLEWTMASGGC